ncbi:PIN domain-containing protein [Phragmitibacter flavus]|nr:PIN domain-containing protein [Phragmitibacter flavus]
MKVLIDSSTWIDFFREGDARHPEVGEALWSQRAVLCSVVWVELWSGVRSKREEAVLTNLRECCGWLEIDVETWRITAELRRAARRKGLNCPLADVLIVACAKRHGAVLMHRDKHFEKLLQLDI